MNSQVDFSKRTFTHDFPNFVPLNLGFWWTSSFFERDFHLLLDFENDSCSRG